MNEMITETGLNIPDNCPKEMHQQIGVALHRVEEGFQWALGDWYNRIPEGEEKKAYCENVGVNYGYASKCGAVAAKFPRSLHAQRHAYKLCETIAYEPKPEKNEEKFDAQELLDKAVKNDWTVARLRKERDKAMGRPEKLPVDTLDARLDKVLADLPKSASNKVRKAIKEAFEQLKHDFQQTVEKVVSERMQKERDVLRLAREEAEAEKRNWEEAIKKVDRYMTEQEYKLVLGCLHPDRVPEEKRDRFNQAFEIFRRLEKTIARGQSAEVAELRGWAKRRA